MHATFLGNNIVLLVLRRILPGCWSVHAIRPRRGLGCACYSEITHIPWGRVPTVAPGHVAVAFVSLATVSRPLNPRCRALITGGSSNALVHTTRERLVWSGRPFEAPSLEL